MSLAALTDSTELKISSTSTTSSISGISTYTMSPNASWAKLVMPTVPMSPSIYYNTTQEHTHMNRTQKRQRNATMVSNLVLVGETHDHGSEPTTIGWCNTTASYLDVFMGFKVESGHRACHWSGTKLAACHWRHWLCQSFQAKHVRKVFIFLQY